MSRTAKIRLIACLALTQLIGWGATFDIISVIATPMSEELGIDRELLYAGPTFFLIISALAGPTVGKAVKRFGARSVLTLGAIIMSIGLIVLSNAGQWYDYMLGWGIVGLGGALGLGSPAFAAVVERDGSDAKRTIGIVLIFAGLSTAASWPMFTFLQTHVGWRNSLLIGAAVLAFVATPIIRFGLTKIVTSGTVAQKVDAAPLVLTVNERTLAFVLIATVSTLFSFVSFGMSPSLIDIIHASGASASMALGLASFRSVLGISARVVDVAFGKKGDAMLTALTAALFIMAGVSVLGILAPSPMASILFVLFYGIGSGIATLARAVLPLNFFAPGEFAVLSGKIMLPQNIGTAFAPLVFNFILVRGGFQAVMLFAGCLIFILLLAIFKLFELRKRAVLRVGP